MFFKEFETFFVHFFYLVVENVELKIKNLQVLENTMYTNYKRIYYLDFFIYLFYSD